LDIGLIIEELKRLEEEKRRLEEELKNIGEDEGIIVCKYVRCSKQNCKSCPHGPYYYVIENGKWKYLGKSADPVLIARKERAKELKKEIRKIERKIMQISSIISF